MPTPQQWSDLENRLSKLGVTADSIIEKFILGSGSGGQKINKTSSCVYLKHLSSGIEVKRQTDRSREQNRYLARQELCRQLELRIENERADKRNAQEKKRRTNRPRSRNSKNRMLDSKSKQSSKKKLRRPPSRND